jgi:Holliday junction resolvasome RuvABC endonuclease subunit
VVLAFPTETAERVVSLFCGQQLAAGTPDFADAIGELVNMVSGGAKAVYFEEVRRHLGVDAAHAYGGFLANLTAWCEHHEIPYQGVPVGTIKQFATGKGNAPKEVMIKAMQALGHAPTDDNEADALALLHWAINRHKGDLNHG